MLQIMKTANFRISGTGGRILLPLIIAIMLSACISGSKPSNPIYYYTLDYETPSVQMANHLPFTLRVERFSVSPPFNSQRIIYAHDGLQRNAYAYHQWIVAPAELLPYFLARDHGVKRVAVLENPAGDIYGFATNLDMAYKISPQLIYTYKNFMFGWEISLNTAAYGTNNLNDKAKVINTENVSNFRNMVSIAYNF